MNTISFTLLSLALFAGMPITANAILIDRGNQLIYDTELDITWLDQIRGFDSDRNLSKWVNGLSYFVPAVNAEVTGWRLPRALPVAGAPYNSAFSFTGSTDFGYNISAPGSTYAGSTASEVAHLYYSTLSNKGYLGIDGFVQQDYGLRNVELLSSLGADIPAFNLHTDYGTAFNLNSGVQYAGSGNVPGFGFAIAVHDGDIGLAASVPESKSATLLLLGLTAILLLRTKKYINSQKMWLLCGVRST